MKYTQITLKADDLLLDPNNPRFSKFHKHETSEDLYSDIEIQEDTLEKMVTYEDVHEVEASIKRTGFLDLDPIFVKKIKNSEKYIVLEGNRRVSAIKTLLKKHKSGTSNSDKLTDEVYESLQSIFCKDLTSFSDNEIDYMLGLRHGGAIKQWEPLPASANLYKIYMREFCEKNSCENSPEHFRCDAKIMKDMAARFSITLSVATKRLKTYRVYTDLSEIRPAMKDKLEKKYSVIEEMIAKKIICDEMHFDADSTFTFSQEGSELFFNVVFGDVDKKPLISGASVGNKDGGSVRDYADVLAKGVGNLRNEFVEKRMYEERESIVDLRSELDLREKERTLKTALSAAAAELKKITQGQLIGNHEIGESELELLDNIKEIIADIDKKISQNRK